jgi:hypothetical protein
MNDGDVVFDLIDSWRYRDVVSLFDAINLQDDMSL